MFEKKDFINVDRKYFKVINETAYHLTLKSKNTGHTWDIECRENPTGRSLIVIQTTLIVSKKLGNTGKSRDKGTEFTTHLLHSEGALTRRLFP